MSFFMQLAADMQRFSRPERRINGPTISHLWYAIMLLLHSLLLFIFFNSFVLDSRSMLKLLDVLVQLDHLKNAKASIPNDFSWYKRYAFNICICHFIFKLRIFDLFLRFSLFLLVISFIQSFSEPFFMDGCICKKFHIHSFWCFPLNLSGLSHKSVVSGKTLIQ